MKARKFFKTLLKELISREFNLPVTSIKEFKNFETELGIYPFQLERLKPVILCEFGIEVKKSELRNCTDLYDLIDLTLEKFGLHDNDLIGPGGQVYRAHAEYTPDGITLEEIKILVDIGKTVYDWVTSDN